MEKTEKMTNMFVLFSDDGNEGMNFCLVGNREQVNAYIAEMDDMLIEDEEDNDARWIFYWVPIEIGVPLEVTSQHQPEVRGREEWN